MRLEEIEKKEIFCISRTSKIYLLKDNNLLKIFNNPKELYEIDKFNYFLDYKNDSFIFPFEFIYDDKNFYGYINKRVSGKTLSDSFKSSNLIKLSNDSIRLEKDMDLVSEGGIIIDDMHEDNIIYDGNILSMIDHDTNYLSASKTRTKLDNDYSYRLIISNLFRKNIEQNKYTKLILEKINKYKYMKIMPSEIIINVKEDLDKTFNEDINTLDELNNIFRR